jgi:hypothetical protein
MLMVVRKFTQGGTKSNKALGAPNFPEKGHTNTGARPNMREREKLLIPNQLKQGRDIFCKIERVQAAQRKFKRLNANCSFTLFI